MSAGYQQRARCVRAFATLGWAFRAFDESAIGAVRAEFQKSGPLPSDNLEDENPPFIGLPSRIFEVLFSQKPC